MSKLHEAWLDYRAEEYPDETESEVLTPLAAAFEAGWFAAVASATGAEISACCPGSTMRGWKCQCAGFDIEDQTTPCAVISGCVGRVSWSVDIAFVGRWELCHTHPCGVMA